MSVRTVSQRQEILSALRQTLRRLEGGVQQEAAGIRPTGLGLIDAALPGGGLQCGALHEILSEPRDIPAAEGFAATLLAALSQHGPVLWCVENAELYGPGLARLGLDPARLVLVRAKRPRDLLWAMEEGLRMPGLVAVLGEPRSLDLTASRRLQLAAEASGVTGLVLSRADHAGSTAALTRWHVTTAPGDDQTRTNPCWQVDLLRCRGAVALDEGGFGRWRVQPGDSELGVAAMVEPMERQVDIRRVA